MSGHKQYRKEKNCLNCGYPVPEHYCSNCGQENLELKEPFWTLFAEGFSDFFHFDSKFTRSVIPLLLNPGFLSLEYNKGRRARYIHPLRLYFFVLVLMLFISGYLSRKIDFGILLRYIKISTTTEMKTKNIKPVSFSQDKIQKALKDTQSKAEKTLILENELRKGFKSDSIKSSREITKVEKMEEELESKIRDQSIRKNNSSGIDSLRFFTSSLKQVKFNLENLHKIHKESFSRGLDSAKSREIKEKVRKILSDDGPLYASMEEFLTHGLKILLILLLPLFALFLKLFYWNKPMFYQEHVITMLHLQSFIILFYSLILLIPSIFPGTLIYLLAFSFWVVLVYIFQTFQTVYKQNFFLTALKTMAFSFLCFISLLLGGIMEVILEISHHKFA